MKALWRGQLPLKRAFWEFAVLYAALANVFATGAAFAALAADLHIVVVVMIFLLPLPYVIVAIVGVWRSAETYQGPPHWAALARYATVIWGTLMIIS
jgi:hypothetical protein